jgi:hypothetical protein
MAAGVFAAPSLASAQYYSYGAPATLPAPSRQVQPMGYATAAYSGEPVPAPTAVPAQEGYAPSPYDQAVSSEPGCTTCNQGGAYAGDGGEYGWGGWGGGDCCCGPNWYGSVAGLYMERNKPNPFQVSFDTTNPIGQLILNTDTIGDWEAGFEVRVGKYLCCGSSAVELGYWTLDDFGGEAYAYDPPGIGGLNTPFDFRSLNFAGTPVNDLFDGAQVHRLRRSNDVHNVEINFINFPMSANPCSRMQASWLAGLRYFRFTEDWQLASGDTSASLGADPANEAYWNINTENNLFGLQIGGRGSFCATQKLSVYAAPRFGAFWNDMSLDYRIATGNGVTAVNISSDEDVVSLMAQLDVGVNYQFTPCIGVWGGYRVMAINGIALTDEQIPFLADDLNGIADIDRNSTLVLHGLMGGVTVSF